MGKEEKPSLFKRLSSKGYEILSGKPKTVAVKIRRPVSDDQRFRQWLDAESKRAAREGSDTYEEFMNFGSDDDTALSTEYELVFDPLLGKEVLPREKIFLDAQRARYDQHKKAEAKKAAEARKAAKPADDYVTENEPVKKAPKSKKDAPE